jgi:hypothetical protein
MREVFDVAGDKAVCSGSYCNLQKWAVVRVG